MAVHMRDVMRAGLGELRVHRVGAQVRARVGDEVVVSSDRALLVWEPRRILPTYAVPAADVYGELVPWSGSRVARGGVAGVGTPPPDTPPPDAAVPETTSSDPARALDPRSPFSAHTAPGRAMSIRTGGQGEVEGAAYEFDDADLAGFVALDFDAFDAWLEEDDPVLGHPQDPFHRVACRRSPKHVVVSLDGVVLADSRRAVLLLETGLPGRYYLPRTDLRPDLLTPSATRTVCPYKGVASYWTARVGERLVPDLAWSYEDPLAEALPVAGRVCFWNERTDLTIDGEPVPRPRTAWSEPPEPR